ncbi:peptide/nickel transport system substrate-binding protein [Microbacterium halimionae]|uniref:Peptide/nickel transport system substrate-binding protein n=1 Tax=Microbacterium halimionae TaxID=1526413 RepID=A0A7W3PN55_9MICO|nr:ABC transporter substrate-binding protein [Microbacterium halimionae]MBA8817619.1 peptide/nickel transport system substrate-binding protein [Microbacterium halimionae]NII94329.1 peptide/nickel transport system substrate-binding protein [Microbacterium halimionae]
MKRSLAAVSAIVVATLALAGCSSGGETAANADDATIYIGSLYEPQNLSNTQGGGQGVTEAFNGNVYEGLYKLTDDGEVEPLLAASSEVSDDGLTYTITLRDDVTFHSGKALTSADVKASVDAVTAEDSQSARKSSFAVISDIATPDDTTVVFTLSERSISFLYNLSYIWIVNSEAGDLTQTEDGTGPYTLDEWRQGSTLTLTRWDDYSGTPATNGEVVFTYFTDATAENNALLTGEIDIITSVQSPDSLTQFTDNDEFVVSEGTSTTKELLAFNDRVAPFDNAQVRKAVYSAIDTEQLLTAIWGDYGTLIGSMVPPTDPWYEDLTNVNPYDPDLAREELAEAGYADGFTFTLDTPSYDPHPAVAEFVQSELAEIGITVEINTISADEWYTKVFKDQDFEATLQEHVNDRDVVWYGNPDFYWGYDNADVQQWVADAEQATTIDEQTELLTQVNEQIAEDAASVWLYLYPQIVVASSDVTGYPVNGLNSQFYAYDIVKS